MSHDGVGKRGLRTGRPDRRRIRFPAALVAAAALAWGGAGAGAADLDGVFLPDTAETGLGPLVLSGCGLREVLWYDIYAVGLYFAEPAYDAATALDPARAKAARVEVLFEGDIPEDLPSKWRARLEDLLKRDVLRTFKDIYRELETGDTLTLSYAPERGTTVELNGEKTLQAPGHEAMGAFLRQWLGPEPVSKNLRRLLLKGRC